MSDNKSPEYPIDLAKKMGELDGTMPMGKHKDETVYPSLYLEWEQPYNFPDSGTMTVKFKKRSEENRKHGDKTMQRVELDITEITDTVAGKENRKEKDEESTGDVLDKAVKKFQKKKKTATPAEESDETEY